MQGRIYFGIVEDRDDFSQLGRCKVRVAGMHTHDNQALPTEDLPWAIVMRPIGGGNAVAPVEGSEVIVMFADEPDCQIPVIMGTVNTIPQAKSVWVDQVPGYPMVRDVTDPVVGHQLSRNPTEDALAKTQEIRVDGPTDQDTNKANQIINNANTSSSASAQVIGDPSVIPNAMGKSVLASTLEQTLGSANPSLQQQLINDQIDQGSASQAMVSYAEKLQSVLGTNTAVDILRGKTSLSAAIEKLQSGITSSIGLLGYTSTDKLVSTLISNISSAQANFNNAVNLLTSQQTNLNVGIVNEAIGNVVSSINGLGAGVSALVVNQSGLNTTFDNIVQNSNTNIITQANQTVDNVLSSTTNNTSTQAVSNLSTQASGVVSELVANGIDQSIVNNVATSFVDNQSADQVTNQLRQCLASGVQPSEVVNQCIGEIEPYLDIASTIAQTVAAPPMKDNWDLSYITEAIKATLASWRASLSKAISYVINGGSNFTDYVSSLFTKHTTSIFGSFNIGSLGQRIVSLIPFGSVISNVISRLFSSLGSSSNDQVGVNSQAVVNAINSGNYSSSAFGIAGNRVNIDNIGAGKVTTSMICAVGEGNTPSIHGNNGGPNFRGGVQVETKPTSIDTKANQSLTQRELVTSIPNIPLSTYGVTDIAKVQANINSIAASIKPKLTTLESQAAFIALVFAYCNCVPVIHDYEYTSKQDLLAKFPRSFQKANQATIDQFLFARSMNKKTAQQFYNYVYDSTNDGQTIGNVAINDGYQFAEAGLLPVIGRNRYAANNITSAQQLTQDLNLAVNVAIGDFINAIKTVPAGDINVFYQALSVYPGIDSTIAKQAFEHFYGAKLFESYQTTEKVAGKQFDRSSYYGSAQEMPVTTGFVDPNGKYPYVRECMKSSINPLAKGDSVNTIVPKKESMRKLGVPIGGSQQTWDQPHSGYHAVYPYNNVQETESGHIIELDDTPQHERIHIYHRKGTFTEINSDGTKITRIVGDNYQIIDRNGFVSIAGQANITAVGSINIRCMSDVNLEVDGSCDIQSHGSLNLGAANDLNISAGGNVNIWGNKGANFQCNENVNIRSVEGSAYFTAKQQVNVVGDQDVNLTSTTANVNMFGKNDVSIEGESGTVNILGDDSVSVSSYNGALQLFGGTNAALSGGNNVDIFAGKDLHMQSAANTTLLTSGFCRIQNTTFDINTKGYLHIDVFGETSLDSTGAININTSGLFNAQSGGVFNIKAGAALSMQAGASASLSAGGTVGIDGTIVGLNSGMSIGALPAVTVPSIAPGNATKAITASGAPLGEKAVIYGMVTNATRTPVYPDIPAFDSEPPLTVGEQVIETIDEVQSNDGKLLQSTLLAQALQYDPQASETTIPFNNGIQGVQSERATEIVNDPYYNANTKLSDHFSLGDFFDGGFNKKHVLQDQAGLTKQQIVANLANLAENILEKLIDVLPGGYGGYRKQWKINSGFRTTANNRASGGAKVSQHMKGQAVDIQLAGGNKRKHYDMIQQIAKLVPYDQLILEYSPNGRTAWIHCSFDINRQRKQCLTIDLYRHKTTQGFVLNS